MNRRSPLKALSAPRALAVVAAALLGGQGALAQTRAPRIWDVELGTPVGSLPSREFVEPSCGTNGGPQGLPIGTFGQFALCPPEADGLREIWFSYDDTAEYAALALRAPVVNRTMTVLDQPVILSLLIDEAGIVRGYRIFTDTRVEHELRFQAYELSRHFKARFDLERHCIDQPPADGEAPIDGQFVKQICQREADGVRMTAEARLFFRRGQQFYDRYTGAPMANAFESWARLEVRRIEPAPAMAANGMAQPPADAPFPDQRSAFLAGASVDCQDCILIDADLRYRDLGGANLAGANLEGALLHRADLRRANLSRANLTGANLNRVNLRNATFAAATLYNAMIFQADAQRADFAGADLSLAMLGETDFGFANFEGANLDAADLGRARLNDTILTGASMIATFLPQALLARSQLQGVNATGASLMEAVLRNANLEGAIFRSADLFRADLTGANLGSADFSGARLVAADLTDTRLLGTSFSGAVMPDATRSE